MIHNELHTRILSAKQLLNNELVRLKTSGKSTPLSYREVNDRLDMLHEIERIGLRNLTDRDLRKLNKMLAVLDIPSVSSN